MPKKPGPVLGGFRDRMSGPETTETVVSGIASVVIIGGVIGPRSVNFTSA